MRWRVALPTGERARRVVTYAAVALAGFLLAWLVVAFVLFPDDGSGDVSIVPAVLGLPFAEAEQRLADAGLAASLGERRLSDSAPPMTVLAQLPAPGRRAARGDTVALHVSAGSQRASVPRLTGMSRDAALQVLRRAGLTPGQVSERAGGAARGTVLATNPDAGQVVPAGSTVHLVLSGGPAELTMPDVTGHELAQARATIEQLGLALGNLAFDSSSTLRSGMVIAQVPAAGSPVATGASINLRVSGKP